MKFGLEQHIIDKLIGVFEQHSKVDNALVFGSRAKGNYRPDSDIDIAIKGQDLNTDDIIAMCVAFEEKGITHKIDLINYDTIKEPDLIDHIDRVGIELYSRWKEVKLGNYIETINGFAFKSTDFLDSEKPNSLPVIKIKNVANGDVNIDGVHYHLYSENLNKYLVENGDILISLTGNHPELETQVVGLVSKYKLGTKALLNQRVGKLFSKKTNELNDDYLYYFLKNKDTHQYLASQSSGSANQANISKTDIEKISFSKPPINEQTAIASILSSLDDKIDLLHRQNKTIEQLAETLFRQWFVEEAEDYELGCFGDVISIFDNLRVPVSSMEREKMKIGKLYPYYGAAKIMDYINDYIFDGEYVLMGEDGTVQTEEGFPILQMPTGKFWVNNHTHVLQAKKPYSNYLIYIFLKQTNINHIITGAVQPKINQENLKLLDYPILPKEKIIDFVKITNDYWEKIKSNQTQIRTLTQTRDTLLPKLMSGEVRVNL